MGFRLTHLAAQAFEHRGERLPQGHTQIVLERLPRWCGRDGVEIRQTLRGSVPVLELAGEFRTEGWESTWCSRPR